MPTLLFVVAAALIDEAGRILLAQRPPGKIFEGLWEFPGGKLEPGETPEAGLIRELEEELGVTVATDDLIPLIFATHAYGNKHILMPLYACHRWQGTPHGREGQAIAWVTAEALGDYQMPPADEPLIPFMRNYLNG